MLQLKRKKLAKARKKTKETHKYKWEKKKKVILAGVVALSLAGTLVGLAQAEDFKFKLFDAPLKSLPLPDEGPVNYKLSGTGTVSWSNGHDTAANFMQVNGATTFCLEPFVDVFNGSYATKAGQNEAAQRVWKSMTVYQRNLINNITYIGEVNNAGADPNLNLATQFSLWLIESGANEVAGLLPKVTEVDTSKLNNVVGGHKITDLISSGADISEVVRYAQIILHQAVESSKNPEFNPNPLTVLAGSSAISTDKNGVIAGGAGGYGLPFDNINASEGLSAKRKGNTLEVSATPKAIGNQGKIEIWNNLDRNFEPSYIYGTINPDGKLGQTLYATTDPATLEGELKVNVIGLGEVALEKTSTNTAFGKKLMAGAEFTLFKANGTAVKWSDGQAGYPITTTAGSKVGTGNVILKMGEDAKVGLKNLDFTQKYYFQETKAPPGFALNAEKIPVSFDGTSPYNPGNNNYQDEVKVQDIPTGSFTLVKVDADNDSGDTQGEATLEGVTYGLFHPDGKPVTWDEGLTDSTPGSSENLPLEITSGVKGHDKNVEVTADKEGKIGVQNLPLKENNKAFYLKETRTSSGYSFSTVKIPLDFSETNTIDLATGDFDTAVKAKNKVNVFGFKFIKAQDVNGSLTGLNGVEFVLTPQGDTKGNPIKAVSQRAQDDSGYMVNGVTVFDGKANQEAGNPNADGIAIGDYLLTEPNPPSGLLPIHPVLVSIDVELDEKDGHPLSYTATFTDTVTKQVIDEITIKADELIDNNVMFKLNLGTFTDKMMEQPKVSTQASDEKDGDKTLGVGHAQIKDKVTGSGLAPDTTYSLESQPVLQATGKPILAADGESALVIQEVKTNSDGKFEVDVLSKELDTTPLQEGKITLLTQVKDSNDKVIVEDLNYEDNPSETVEVDKAEGYTKVQEKEVIVGTTEVTDRFYYEGLVKGNTYTVQILKAYDHELKKEIDVKGEATFTTKDTKGDVDVTVEVETDKYAGHTLTFYEEAFHGEKVEEDQEPIISRHDKDDVDETFKITVPEEPKKPEEPKEPKEPIVWVETAAKFGSWIGLVLLLAGVGIGGFVWYKKRQDYI